MSALLLDDVDAEMKNNFASWISTLFCKVIKGMDWGDTVCMDNASANRNAARELTSEYLKIIRTNFDITVSFWGVYILNQLTRKKVKLIYILC